MLRLPVAAAAAASALLLAAGSGTAQGELVVSDVRVTALSPRSVELTWTTSLPATALAELGTGPSYGLWAAGSEEPEREHRLVLTELVPDRTYHVRMLVDSAAERATVALEARTPPLERARLRVSSGGLFLNGQPFLPLLQHQQCPEAFAENLPLRFNLFSDGCPGVRGDDLVRALAGRAAVSLPVAQAATPGAAAFTFPDEPDANGFTPGDLRRLDPGPAETTLMTLTADFFTEPRPGAVGRARSYAEVADVVGFDLYPINRCRRDRLAEVHDAQALFSQRVAPNKPTFQWIEASLISPWYCDGRPPEPEEVRAQAFMAIAGGADGIGFFTHVFDESGGHDRLDVAPEVAAQLAHTNRQLETLAPALLSPSELEASADAGAVKVLARGRGGAIYVVAVNAEPRPVRTRIAVEGLGDRTLSVWEEGREVRSTGGVVVDELAPYEVHVYVAPPAGAERAP